MKIYRQGDVLIVERKIPETAEKVSVENRIILAEGEATGHHHAINNTKDAALFFDKKSNKLFIMILKPLDLVHEEHAPIKLPLGNYEVIKQREYHPKEIRNVAD